MLKYLKAAFLVRPDIPGLGKVPVNVITLICLGILGCGNAGFWLLGCGLELVFLYLLAFNPRFQHVVDALETVQQSSDAEVRRQQLIGQLPLPARQQYARVQDQCRRILDIYRSNQADDFVIDNNRDALAKLSWIYLKLLIARQNLTAANQDTSARELTGEIEALKQELAQANLTAALRESKSATLAILQKRLENLGRREQSLQEVGSDLTRIEAQLDLARENAALHNRNDAITGNIELASRLLDGDMFGASEATIADLDQTFGQTPPATAAPPPAAPQTGDATAVTDHTAQKEG